MSVICLFDFCEKLQNIFEIGLKKYGVIVQKSLLKKKDLEIKNLQTQSYCCLGVFPFKCKQVITLAEDILWLQRSHISEVHCRWILSNDPGKNCTIFYCSAAINFPHIETVVFSDQEFIN